VRALVGEEHATSAVLGFSFVVARASTQLTLPEGNLKKNVE